MEPLRFANARVWDARHSRWASEGRDLDWGGRWTEPWLPYLREHRCHDVLEMGCGTGADAARVAAAGYRVTAFDVSRAAVGRACRRARERSLPVRLLAADMAGGLPFRDGSFDAVISNVAMHYFPDEEVKGVVREVVRVLRPGGLLLFHVNSTAEREVNGNHLNKREVAPNFYVGDDGSTVRLFREADLHDLLAGWDIRLMEHVEVPDRQDMRPKSVWRCAAAAPRA